jgi:hypothetical protein
VFQVEPAQERLPSLVDLLVAGRAVPAVPGGIRTVEPFEHVRQMLSRDALAAVADWLNAAATSSNSAPSPNGCTRTSQRPFAT